MNVTKKLKIDLNNWEIPPVVDVVQGDSARVLEITLMTGLQEWLVPLGAAVVMQYRCPDGAYGTYDTLENGEPAFSVSGNVVTVRLVPQVCGAEGTAKLQITIVSEGKQLSAFFVDICVQKRVGHVHKGGNYTNLAQWWAQQGGGGLPMGGFPGQGILLDAQGYAKWKTLTRADVGLENVDNTSDMEKPVSAATAAAIAVERARIDSLTALPGGSTSADAELADIRVGYDGKVYSCAGDAVRSQLKQVKPAVDSLYGHEKDSNFIDKEKLTAGYIGGDGEVEPDGYLYCTDFIPLESGMEYYYSELIGQYTAFYDENKVPVAGGIGEISNPFTVPEGAVYGRFTIHSACVGVSWISQQNQAPRAYSLGFAGVEVPLAFQDGAYWAYDGTQMPLQGYSCTQAIPVFGGAVAEIRTAVSGANIVVMDRHFNVKQRISGTEGLCTYRVSGIDGYLGISCLTRHKNKAYLRIKSLEKPLIPTEHEGFEISIFNKILCVGDSLTAGTFNHGLGGNQYEDIGKYSYPTYLEKLTGVETVNLGLGSRTAANWYSEMKNQDLSGFDCAIIQLGVNDALMQEGGWNDTSRQAYSNIIAKLKRENKRIKIFVSTIIPADAYLSDSLIAASERIRNWYAGLSDKTDIFLLDMAVYGHTNDSAAYQAGHLSAYGYLTLAKDYQSYISYVIATEKEKFQLVQFSNSEYNYRGY